MDSLQATVTPAGFVQITRHPMKLLLENELPQELARPELGQMLRSMGRAELLLDVSDFISFETARWITRTWAPLLSQVGIRTLAIVTGDAAKLQPMFELVESVRVRAFVRGDPSIGAFLAQAPAVAPAYAPAPAYAHPSANPRRVHLGLPPRGYGFAAMWGGVVGTLLGAGAASLVLVAAEEPVGGDVVHLGEGAFLGLTLAIAGVLTVHFARATPAAVLCWDEQAVEEWVGGKLLTRIPWAVARVGMLRSAVVYRNRGRVTGRSEGRTLQITDTTNAATITIGDGFQQPPFVENRPCHVESLPAELVARAEAIPIAPDKLGYGRGARWGFGVVAMLAYAAWGVACFVSSRAGVSTDLTDVAALLLLGCVFFGVRMIWPITKLGSRGTVSALVELGLRLCVIAFFGGLSIYFFVARSD